MATEAPKRSALVVDDNPEDVQRAKKVLEECGFSVVVAEDTQIARTRMRFQNFDLLVLEALLPKETGIQLLIALHETAAQSDQKNFPAVVIVSNMSMTDQIREKLTKYLGVKLILPKPLEAAPLVEFIHSRFASKSRTHAYDAATLNKFLNGTRETIALNSQIAPVPGKPFVRVDGQALGEFTGIIEIRSATQHGFVALSFERPCCEALARKIFQDAEMALTDPILRDISGEMCNQVVGNVQAQFQRDGIRFEISTPTIVSGLKYRVDHKLDAPSVVIPFEWNGNRFYTQFVMENRKDSDVPKEQPKEEKAAAETMDSGDINFL